MSTESIDYTAILRDLEAKKSTIEGAIASIRSLLALGLSGQSADALNGFVAQSENRSIPEAAKLYLEIIKRKQSSRQIAEALEKDGWKSNAKDFAATVNAVLNKSSKSTTSPIVKVGGQWTLREWSHQPEAQAAARPETKRSTKKPSTGKASEKVLQALHGKGEHSIKEIAEWTGLSQQVICGAVGTLGKAGKLEKTATGNFRAKVQAEASAAA